MPVDKNLFLHDTAIVAIMKNEAPYIKEWLDYHLLAGVDHFYIYDNDSPDNQKEILQPYIERGFVTYIFYPGRARQYEAYNEATRRFRFFCRYIAFIDGDEFIFPKNDLSIPEVTDKILSEINFASALAMNIHEFGSNFQDKADFNRGVLERFTRRASDDWAPLLPDGVPGGTARTKAITNPRKINYFWHPHFAIYHRDCVPVNELGKPTDGACSSPVSTKFIVLNHYKMKSKEEYFTKMKRGMADNVINLYEEKDFSHENMTNDVEDTGILKYRDERKKIFMPDGKIDSLAESKKPDYEKIFDALTKNLLRTNSVSPEFFIGKAETFLTCRALAAHLRDEKIIDEETGNFLEETALKAVHKAMVTKVLISDFKLLLDELPLIISRPYPIIDEICESLINMISQFVNTLRGYDKESWKEFVTLKHSESMIRAFVEIRRK